MKQKTLNIWLRHRGMILQALLLALIWLLLSGKLELIYLFWGTISIIFVLWMTHRLHNIPMAENESCEWTFINIPRLILYLSWLLLQIIHAGFHVAYVVLHPNLPINPMLVRFTSKQPNVLAKVILGNSITLTPGTLTLNIVGDQFTVHALTRETAEDLISGNMETWVASLYMQDYIKKDMCCNIEFHTCELGE